MLNGLKLYRYLRGGVWVQYYDKVANGGMFFWKRYEFISDAAADIMYNAERMMTVINYVECYEPLYSVHDLFHLMNCFKEDKGTLSDGYHTFNELYDHRNCLFVALSNLFTDSAFKDTWKSKNGADGISCGEDWFIAGIDDKITYHLPKRLWDELRCKEVERSKWDGHDSKKVVERLKGIERLGAYSVRIEKDKP